MGYQWPPRRIAESSAPAFEEIHNANPIPPPDDRDFSWEEDAVSRWRALALFGGLSVVEGAWCGGLSPGAPVGSLALSLVALGFAIAVGGGLLAGTLGKEYVWAVFGASGLAIGLGTYWTVAGATWVPLALLFGGLIPLIAGLTLSVTAQMRLRAEDDSADAA